MKQTLILIGFLLSLTAQTHADPCTEVNVYRLLANSGGGVSDFYSRRQANDCLRKARDGGVPGVKVEAAQDGYLRFTLTNRADFDRYLKPNKNDYFLSKRLLGGFKYRDGNSTGNRISSVAKFNAAACTLTADQCEAQNKDFNRDYCQCEDKEKLYCNKWNFEKYNRKKSECDQDDEKSWDEETCECSAIKVCVGKNWSKKKKEREADKCADKEGHTWDDDSCTCTEKLYCVEVGKNWSYSKYNKESDKCDEDPRYTWDPATCTCNINNETTHMCNGRPVEIAKYKSDEEACEAKNNQSNPSEKFEWNPEQCRCDKEKVERICDGGESISLRKFERKKSRCQEKIEHDDRYSWDDDSCECLKKPKDRDENSCGGKGWSQNKIDRKKKRCDDIKGKWNAQDCSCEDPCYDVETRREEEEIPCTDKVPKLGEVKIDELQAKVCDQALPATDQQKIKEQCQSQIEALQRSSTETSSTQKYDITIQYTSSEQILCNEHSVSVAHNKELDHPLPGNVPTTDLSQFEGNCSDSKGVGLKGDLKRFRPYGNIDCEKWASIQEANKEILEIANKTSDDFLKDLGVTGKITPQEMNELLSKSKITLNVLGTANRSNNGTGISLQELANKRQEEAERVIKDQIIKKLKEYVNDPSYSVPSSENLFQKTGHAQAIGPLNPQSSEKSMLQVINEKEAPAGLKACSSAKLPGKTRAKAIYDCSVDFFIDQECPQLPDHLKNQFCNRSKEQLKAETTAAFLSDFKMFQVGVNMSSNKTQKIYGQVGTIQVRCTAEVGTEEIPGSDAQITDYLKVTKPGFFRRLRKDCREERRQLNDQYGRRNVRRAANQRKNPNGIVIGQ